MMRCIFHYPGNIEENPKKGSELRPKMMLEAFKSIGYTVDEVTGDGNERKEKIKNIKKNIKNGVKYDFLYSESRNIPNIFAEKKHFPLHPILDFKFWKFCRSNGIKIGIFYRDMYWKFDLFKKNVPFFKRIFLVPAFKYDLWEYSKLANILYLPSKLSQRYIPYKFNIQELPPGSILKEDILEERKRRVYNKRELHIFYVGGIVGLYDIRKLFEAVADTEKVFLTVCTPQDQWETNKKEYVAFLCNRIRVVHKDNSELESFYKNADIVSVCFEKDRYRDLAVPIKLYEAISYGVPIIASNSIYISDLIQKHNIGWYIEDYSVENLKSIFEILKENPEDITKKTECVVHLAYNNTWEKRAEKVKTDFE